MIGGGHFQRGDEGRRQGAHVAAHAAVQAPGVVGDFVLAGGVVGHALLTGIDPRERRLDAVAGVVGKRQADGAGGRHGEQVRVADAMRGDVGAKGFGQTLGEAAVEVFCRVEQREGALLLGEIDRGGIGRVAQGAGQVGGEAAGVVAVIAQAEHHAGVAQAEKAQADAAFVLRLVVLLDQRPIGDVEHVVEHAHRDAGDGLKTLGVEPRLRRERIAHKSGEIDRAQAAAAVVGQKLLGARVGRLEGFAVIQIVVSVGGVEKQNARLGVVVGGLHDLIPQRTRPHATVHPLAVGPLMRAFGELIVARPGLVHQIDLRVVFDRLHERGAHADRQIEVLERALVFGVDEGFDVGMVDAQHAHLRAPAAAGRFHRFARGVEHPHERQRAAGAAVGAADMRTHRADARKVVAHAAAAPHGFGGLRQRFVNAGFAFLVVRHRIAHGLDEAVDQRGLNVGARRRHDASGRHEAVGQRLPEQRFAAGRVGLFDRQGAGDARVNVCDGVLIALGVFLRQNVETDVLCLHDGGLKTERPHGGMPAAQKSMLGLYRVFVIVGVDFGQTQQGLRLIDRQRFHLLELARHGAGASFCRTDGIARFVELLARFCKNVAEFCEFRFHRTEHFPHLGRALFQRQSTKTHVQAVEQGQQGSGPGEHHTVLALQRLHQARSAQRLGIQTLGGQEQNAEVAGVRRGNVFALDGLGFLAQTQFKRLRSGLGGGFVSLLLRVEQALIVFARKLGVDRQPDRAFALARQANGVFHPGVAAGYGFHVDAVLLGGEHLLDQAGQLNFAEHPARFHIGEHPLQIAHALRQGLHFAQATVHQFQPLGDLLEALAQPLLQGGVEFFVHGGAHLFEFFLVVGLQLAQAQFHRAAHFVQVLVGGLAQLGEAQLGGFAHRGLALLGALARFDQALVGGLTKCFQILRELRLQAFAVLFAGVHELRAML